MDQGNSVVPQEFVKYFESLYKDALDILVERQEGYGPSNIEALGPYGVFSRLASDKVSRIANELNGVIDNGEAIVTDEWYTAGVHDALMDIANYAMILVSLGQGQWSKVARGDDSELWNDAYDHAEYEDDEREDGLQYHVEELR
jgi:hypothetical protein